MSQRCEKTSVDLSFVNYSTQLLYLTTPKVAKKSSTYVPKIKIYFEAGNTFHNVSFSYRFPTISQRPERSRRILIPHEDFSMLLIS